jgi:hypothetical protein
MRKAMSDKDIEKHKEWRRNLDDFAAAFKSS